ncbi:hypothetical protein [Methanosarcina sp. WWM596]|uniref:hypothetical protein n=1 Tax=Methanosarcina sp. WWM596 TaxID=1434103 RepID=UPI00064E8EEA|nr:hypothetical protein [Methanosarcina sp. WWM596]
MNDALKAEIFNDRQYAEQEKRTTEKETGGMNLLERVWSKTSTNFINNLYIGVNEASNPLSHRNQLPHLAQIDF